MDMLHRILDGQSRQQMDDFVRRYDRGSPWDGIDDGEALDHYRRVTPILSDDQYIAAAEQSFSRLSPEQRAGVRRLAPAGGKPARRTAS
jgi:hypothetical protein